MLKGHRTFKVGPLTFEVNWSNDEEVKDCQLIRIHVDENARDFTIKKQELNAILFTLGTSDEQMKMIPQVETRSRHYETVVGVKTDRDIAKGEEVIFPISIALPSFEEEIIAEAKRDLQIKQGGFPLIT